jgi:hypothetical protein
MWHCVDVVLTDISEEHIASILSLCSSLNVRDKVSYPYRTTGKIIVVYVLMFMCLDRW